jgi:hypothetical protein
MGVKLAEYFKKANEIAGLSGQVKLAMITKMSSNQASEAPDSPENIQLFNDALSQISGS